MKGLKFKFLIIILSIIPVYLFLKDINRLSFQIILGLICFPFVLLFKESTKAMLWRYLIVAILIFITYIITGVYTLIFVVICFNALFLLENIFGKINFTSWIYLILISPVFTFVAQNLSFPIRLWLTDLAAKSLQLINYPVSNQGNIIFKNNSQFSVDPECLGLNMISLCLILSLVIKCYFEKNKSIQLSFVRTLLFLIIALFFAIFANYTRIILLVIFNSLPNTISHELIGILTLIFYAILPIFIINYFYFKNKNGNIVYTNNINYAFKNPLLVFIVFSIIIIIKTHFFSAPSHIKPDNSFSKIHLSGYKKSIDKNHILKLQNSTNLIYIKPSVNFYGAPHSPLFCWTGSGYLFSNQTIVNDNNLSYYKGILTLKNDTIYTAWWFDNGTHKTIHQLDWRLDTFKGSEPYRLININSNSKDGLNKLINQFINYNLFD